MSPPAFGMSGHVAFRRDVTFVHAYVRMLRSKPGSSLPASLGANLRPRFSCS